MFLFKLQYSWRPN